MNSKKSKVVAIAEVGIFASLSVILYYLRFSLPFLFPGFLELQFSALPIVIAGYALGPKYGVLVLVIKTLVCLPFTTTACVGDLADFLINLSFVLVTSMVYLQNKTKKNAAVSLVLGSVAWLIVSALANYFILVPFYINLFMGGDVNIFVGACSIVPNLDATNYRIMYVLLAALPFNLMISTVVSLITFIVYKRISKVIDKFEA